MHENFGKKIVYLGSYLALQEKDMSYLNNAFNSAVTWGQLTITNSGCDHSIHAWNILPHIFCANRFRDIEKIFPKENGLSKNCKIRLPDITQMKRKKNLFGEALILYKNQKKIAKISARNRNVDWLQVKIAEIKKDKKKLERKK